MITLTTNAITTITFTNDHNHHRHICKATDGFLSQDRETSGDESGCCRLVAVELLSE